MNRQPLYYYDHVLCRKNCLEQRASLSLPENQPQFIRCLAQLQRFSITYSNMLDIMEAEPLKDLTIFHAVYKRCMNYIQIVTENPAYQASRDEVFVQKIVSRIPYSEICGKYFTMQKRAMHRIFSGLVLK